MSTDAALTRISAAAARAAQAASNLPEEPRKRVAFDVERVRQDFPILGREVNGHPLVYLDNAATSQKPNAVLDAERAYYAETNANVHRGVHRLSEQATLAYEAARTKVGRFVNASSENEIVFVRGTTEAINLIASSFVRPLLTPGDEILITHLEHHSNIVPWQLLCEATGAVLRVAPIDDRGDVIVEEFERLLGSGRVRFVSIAHVSNALGTVLPVVDLVARAHAHGAFVLVDGAQAVPHLAVDVQSLGAEFYAFSGHKMFGPTGIGVLWGRQALLDLMPPWQGGGDMIASVSFEKTTYNRVPYKFEAGTPNIAGAVGLGAAVDYLEGLGLAAVAAYEHDLLAHGTEALAGVPGITLVGTAREKASVLSFSLEGVHPHDVGTILDQEGIAIRTGHHCAQPVMDRYGVPGTARASLAFYNTHEEIDALVHGLARVREVFAA